MEKSEQDNRVDALHEACRHRLAKETADDVVKNAEKYYGFLQGETADSSE